MKMMVLKHSGSDYPDFMEMDTDFIIGDTLKVEYDYDHGKKGLADFTVVDIYCNHLVFPIEVMLTLHCGDTLFKERCRCATFEVFETLLKSKIRKEAIIQ